MTTDHGRDYYIKKRPELMKKYNKVEVQLAGTLHLYFNNSKIQNLLVEIRKAYEALIPDLPYIGGDTNPTTQNLIDGAFSLPILLSLEQGGLSMRDMSKIIYKTFESVYNLTPPEKRQQIGDFYFSEAMGEMARKACSVSQLRKYPEDWVYTYVEGDGLGFDYGYDFSECGIVKFYKQMGAERFTPILCLPDYANFRSLGVGFKRTRKISMGNPICDFRFKKGFDTPSGWPPDDLEETFPF
jgi:hypothetical protein